MKPPGFATPRISHSLACALIASDFGTQLIAEAQSSTAQNAVL